MNKKIGEEMFNKLLAGVQRKVGSNTAIDKRVDREYRLNKEAYGKLGAGVITTYPDDMSDQAMLMTHIYGFDCLQILYDDDVMIHMVHSPWSLNRAIRHGSEWEYANAIELCSQLKSRYNIQAKVRPVVTVLDELGVVTGCD